MEPVPPPPKSASPIRTYHCLCTHLIVATTTPLSSLPRRSSNSLDRAYILSLPPPPSSTDPDSDSDDKDKSSAPFVKKKNAHYALLLSTTVDRKPQMITRTDGFEKRYLQKCGRCRVVVGYQLDWGQYGEKEGRREDAVYLLPGGLLSTEEMGSGTDMSASIRFEGL